MSKTKRSFVENRDCERNEGTGERDNIEMDLDVTNGAQGEVVDIILHPDQPPISDNDLFPFAAPSCISSCQLLVKLSCTHVSRQQASTMGSKLQGLA